MEEDVDKVREVDRKLPVLVIDHSCMLDCKALAMLAEPVLGIGIVVFLSKRWSR